MREPKVKYTINIKRKIIEALEKYPHHKPKDIAKEIGIPYEQIHAVSNYFGIRFKQYRENQIIKDYKSGSYSYKDLVNKYGYSKTAIYRILKRNDLIYKKRRKGFRNIEKKLKEYNYVVSKVAEFYKADFRTIKNYLQEI